MRRRADKKGPLKKIVVFQNAKLGDMVCTTPVFRTLKRGLPDIHVCVAGDSVNGLLLEENADVDEYFVAGKSLWRTIFFLRRRRFDAAFLVAPSPDVLAALYLSGVPLVVAPRLVDGGSPYQTQSYRMLLRFVVSVPHHIGRYAPREYLRVLEPIGIVSEDTTKYLGFSLAAKNLVSDFFKDRGIDYAQSLVVGITPSAGNKMKLWPCERFAAVADFLYDRYSAHIIIVGGKNDIKEIQEMVQALKPATPYIVAQDFSIDELKALVSKLSLVIGVDTGIIYIAEAFGVPTIDIVGPVDDADQPPRGEKHAIVKAPRIKAAMGVMNNIPVDISEMIRQSDDITVAMVCKAIEPMISKTASFPRLRI
ncbi:MAG: glycosyltransferase family 9 protein [bacterium]|nr:glycosyltransferase family 9 protein [bacterium]